MIVNSFRITLRLLGVVIPSACEVERSHEFIGLVKLKFSIPMLSKNK